MLVVGASATGLQLADEIHRSGRPVTIAVGEHMRMPRVYRGLDIQWWLEAVGILDERYDEVDDIARARRVPSPQLVGSPERRTLDLNVLIEQGVDVVGRLVGVNDGRLQFSARSRTTARWPISSSTACSIESTHGARAAHRRRRRSSPSASSRRASKQQPRLTLDLDKRPVRDDRLGDGPSAGLLVAASARARPQGSLAPRRRRRCTRAVRARPELHATAQIELHPRRRGRRARP